MGVTEGELLAGKYRIERVLGQGGMGVVVAAHHLVLDQAVAIKFLLPEALHSAEAVATKSLLPGALHSAEAVMRFEREARAAVKIKSEHVARVTDVGRLETGAPYMVMELLRGRDLGEVLQQNGPLPLEDVADYVLQAGEAIAEAHGLGIVHRDLKPPNLFLTERADGSPCVKVLDFGISKVANAGSSSGQGMTRTSAVMGSPLYMSPEQLMSARDVDMRADIWALGVICHELLTGKPPFVAETLPQLCMVISTAAPTPLRVDRPDLPLELEQLLLRCLEKDRGKRVATVAELAAELVKFAPSRSRLSAERIERLARAAGFSASAVAVPPSSASEPVATTSKASRTLGEFGRTKPQSSSNKLRASLMVGAVLASAGVAAFALSRRARVDNSAAAGAAFASPEPQGQPAAQALSAPSPVTSAVSTLVTPTSTPVAPPASSLVTPPISTGLAPPAAPPAVVTAARPAPTRVPVRQAAPHPAVVVTHPEKSAAPDCSVPYFFDSGGNKVFKKECL